MKFTGTAYCLKIQGEKLVTGHQNNRKTKVKTKVNLLEVKHTNTLFFKANF
jgi:hypothetical protein